MIKRIAEEIRNTLRRADLLALWNLFPGESRPCTGLHRRQGPKISEYLNPSRKLPRPPIELPLTVVVLRSRLT